MFTYENEMNKLFVDYVNRQLIAEEDGRSGSNIQLENNLNIAHNYQSELSKFVENYDIYIDTNVFMNDSIGKFLSNIVYYLAMYNKKMIVVDAVIKELQFISGDTKDHNAWENEHAKLGLEYINVLVRENYIIKKHVYWEGKENVRFADKCFDSIFALERTEKNILLLTFDKKLGRDMIQKNDMASVKTKHYINVRCINDDGFLIHPTEHYGKASKYTNSKESGYDFKYNTHKRSINSRSATDIYCDVEGDITGIVTGNILGDVDGDIIGIVNGNILGDVDGDILGTVNGDINGDVDGDILGIVYGDLNGDVDGDVLGTVNGDINGDIDGDILGTVNGDINGNVAGNILGIVTGNVNGAIDGKISGNVIGKISAQVDLDEYNNLNPLERFIQMCMER